MLDILVGVSGDVSGLLALQEKQCWVSESRHWATQFGTNATLSGVDTLNILLSRSRLGGPDPLDFISVLKNKGNEAQGTPPHWHFVSFGFSDLYGDERIHK